MTLDVTIVGESEDTPVINYTPDAIDEYMVIVNLPDDWETVHNYIIDENEIDGIPNRKVECSNDQPFSLRTSIYMMSAAEAEVLKTHPRVETVELNPDKYPQPQSLDTYRYKKSVAFNKPLLTNGQGSESTGYTNGVRSNWSHLFLTNPTSTPYKGVGITTADTTNSDVIYSLTGKNVDAVTIDTGIGVLHPEFIDDDGTYRVFDVILDGPYKVDPAAFSGYTSSVTIDGVNIGTRADESRARSWWSNTGIRSAAFQSLGTVTISSSYTRIHAHSKNGTGAVTHSHGTSCASQIGGKSFGLAIEANLWNIRINLGEGGIIGGDTSLNICTIWHNAKKVNSGNPDPTILNNSWGSTGSTGNSNGSSYSHTYRGQSLTYTGTGNANSVPANSGSCRNHKYFTTHTGSGYSTLAYTGDGQYTNSGSTTNTAAENAIAAGVIVVSSAGNTNQKLSDKNDIDFDNLYAGYAYVNRTGGVQQGFSGDHERHKGTIRVGALDCAVEPYESGGLSKQGVAGYSIRKVVYSANGPMINIWAPAEFTMAAAYASGETYQRQDNSSFYDSWFNGTSSACPNTVSLLCLFLESNRSANQDAVRHWLDTTGSTEIALSDPYPDLYQEGYWSLPFNATYDAPIKEWDGYNIRGNGNLRGGINRVLTNPYASNTLREIKSSEGVTESGLVSEYNANNSDSYSEDTYAIAVTNSGTGAYTLTGNDRPDGTPTSSWGILMHTTGHKGQTGGQGATTEFGNTGSSTWRSITASSTGANNRDAFGDGAGLYNAFFTASDITKIALVDGTGNMSDMTSHNNYLIYDLVGSGTGSETIWDILYRLDQYNVNNSPWQGNDTVFGTDSCTDFTAGTAKSGTLSAQGGSWEANAANPSGTTQLSEFHIWGVNRDSDNDTQVLCSCAANLATGKADSWRNNNPDETFWSYWGNDWHSNTQSQTIGGGKQTDPGVVTGETAVGVYLMALTGSGGADGGVSGDNPDLNCRVGDTMKFNVNASGHPFWIKTSNSTGTGNAAAGVTNNGSDSATVTWDTSIMNAGTYHYNCQNHSAMHGTITLTDNSWKDLWAGHNGTFTSFGGSGRRSIWESSNGGIIDFDGSASSPITLPSTTDFTFGTGDFTIEFWANPDDFGSRGTFYDSRPSGGTTGITIGHESSSGEIRVYMIATSGSDIVVQSSDFATGQWQHIVVTRSSGTVSLYINGTLKDSGTRTSDLNNTNVVNIGYKTYTSSTYDYFDGKIGEVRIYKGSGLTAAEVEHNYNTTKERYTDLADVTVQGSFGESKLTYVGDSNTVVAGLKLHTHTNDIVVGTEPPPPPTYSVSQSTTSINEGSSVTYTVTTTDVNDGTTLYWSLSGTATASDFNPASLTGSFTITNNTGAFSVTAATDSVTDPAETFTASVRTGSTSGTVVATASQVTITDVVVPSYSVSPSTTSVTEGANVVFNVSTQNVANGTTLFYSLSGSATAADFTPPSLTGSFGITSNAGSFTITLVSDGVSDTGETFIASVRTGSITGTVVATASQVTISDPSTAVVGQQEYTTPGTYSWTCPANVTSVCAVVVGGGGGGGGGYGPGGGGGGLSWKNNISVTAGQSYTVVVGNGGAGAVDDGDGSLWTLSNGSPGSESYFVNTSTVRATGGNGGGSGTSSGGTDTAGDGGGSGGLAVVSGAGYHWPGGGAGGYSGDGGRTGSSSSGYAGWSGTNYYGHNGAGGAGGGGGYTQTHAGGGGGGGVGIYGEGTAGSGGGGGSAATDLTAAGGGSGGTDGAINTGSYQPGNDGGNYGGGGGCSYYTGGDGGGGAVRIIWGSGRAFPSTNTGDQTGGMWPLDVTTAFFNGVSPHYRYENVIDSTTTGFFLKPDGTRFYTMHTADDKVRRHDMSSAWDISTCSAHSVSSIGLAHPGGGPAKGLYFKPDGTKLFYVDSTHMRAYDLSTAWDITTLSAASDSHDFSSNLNSISGTEVTSLNFKPDGTKIYISETAGNTANSILEYNLSTAWDLSTVSYVNKDTSGLLDAGTRNNVRGFTFRTDGTTVQISSAANTYGARLTLGTAWDITTLNTTNSTWTQHYQIVSGFYGYGMNFQFKSDGLIYYFMGGTESQINEMKPTTAWLVQSADSGNENDFKNTPKYVDFCQPRRLFGVNGNYGFRWVDSGNKMAYTSGSTTKLFNATTPYDMKSLSNSGSTYKSGIGGWGTQAVTYNSAGTSMLYGPDVSGKDVRQYSLGTAWDVSSISGTTPTNTLDLTSGSGMSSLSTGTVSENGLYIYAQNGTIIYQWTLSTAFDLSTASYTHSQSGYQSTSYGGFMISPDGTQVFILGTGYSKTLYQYTLSTPFNITTGTYDNKSVDLNDSLHKGIPVLIHSPCPCFNPGVSGSGKIDFFPYYGAVGISISFS